ncbi:MAG: DUF3367 domain-containing protein [Candidatus Levybacteria bacterium]|nr:DUF3367 domain-containing protein [Candidatus Levybacteria bacterium]
MKKRIIIDLAIIFIIGLLPILWLPGDSVLLGHDAGLAIDPLMHFLDRIHVWSQRFSLGTDQNGALLGAFLIHGFEALLAYLGLNLHFGQIVQFIFWFTLPGLAMYFFAASSFRDKKYLPLIASIIYMLNFYLLQGWFIAERTKFSIYIAFPFVLYFLIRYLTGKMKFLPSILFSGIILGIFNGGGSVPLYGGLLFSVTITFIYINIINLNLATLKRTVLYTLGVAAVYFILNAYWIIPYGFYVVGFYGRDLANVGGSEGILEWAKYLSAKSTFINLFRGQGIPDWYLNPFHAYSQKFLTNPILILGSFLLPILAYAAFIFIKNKRDAFFIYLLILISLVGILFSSGPESQFGFIYEAMVRFVPGFGLFRSAFYKFNYMVWFSYGILIGFTLDVVLSKIEAKYFKKHALAFSKIALILIVALYVLYHYPALDGSFLDYSHEPGKELTTRVNVPKYVLDFGRWVNAKDPNARYLVMPQLGNTNVVSYDWHYWSIAPLTSLLSRNSFVHNTALVPESERVLMNEMYAAFLRGDMESFRDFADVFAIDGVLLEKDYDWKNVAWGTIDPREHEETLKANPDLFTLEKSFGKWDVYKFSFRNESLRINSSTKLTYLQGKLGKVVSFPYFSPKSPLFISDIEGKNTEYYAKNASDIYLAPECVQCDLEYIGTPFSFYNPKLLPGSALYPFITFREEQVKASSKDFMSLLNFYITTANRRLIEVKWMVETRNKIGEIIPTVERYRGILEEIALHLNKDEAATIENRAAILVTYHIGQQIGLLDSIYREQILSVFERQALARAYNEILNIDRLAREKLWATTDMTNKKYIYDLPLTGEYEMFVKRGSLTYPDTDASDTVITFRGSQKELRPVETIGDWLSFGKVNLLNKKTFIAIKDGTLSNLVEQVVPSFTEGEEGIIVNNINATFTIDSLNKCFYYQFHDLEFLNTQYAVSFTYRNFSDNNSLSFFHQFEGDEMPRYGTKDFTLTNFRYANKFTKLITPKNGNIRLVFCNAYLSLQEIGTFEKQLNLELLPERQNLIEITGITFHKVSYPNVVLYKRQKDIEDINTVTNFSKIDPVTYEVNLTSSNMPISLMMRESYGKYWRVCDEKNKCLSYDDPSHFQNAGFANAWFMKDSSMGNKLNLYYYPQRWYEIGTIITFASITLVLGICLRLFIKR